MSSSMTILRLLSEKAAAGCRLRRPISLFQTRSFIGSNIALRQVAYSSPWLMLPPSIEKGGGSGGGGGMSYNFYSLAENKVVSFKKKYSESAESPDDDALIVGSSHGWLALYNQSSNRRLFLSNPITGENIKLPPLCTSDIPESLFEREDNGYECVIRRVVLNSPPHEKGCCAIMNFAGHLAVCGLQIQNPGSATACSNEWFTTIGWGSDKIEHDDVVFFTREDFYGIIESKHNETLDLIEWSIYNPHRSPELEEEWRVPFDGYDHDKENYPFFARSDRERELKQRCRSRLTHHLVHVQHTDQLLLVKRHIIERMGPDGSPIKDPHNDVYPHKTIGFDVHVKVKEDELRYMEDSLDGLVLFVGLNQSLALRAADFPELKPDSIYFTEAAPFLRPSICPDEMYGGHDIGIFDYKKRTISPCYYPCDHGSLKKVYPSPFWFTPSPH